MRLLIISDLHIGMKAIAKELFPYAGAEYKDEKLVTAFGEILKEYRASNGNFDFVIIPGDITHQANLIEYKVGSDFVKKIIQEIEVESEKVIFVPGNHDVDWSIMEGKTIYEEEKKYRSKHKYNTLLDEDHLISKLTTKSLVVDPFIKKWEFENAVFFGYNSSWHDDSQKDNHFGLIEMDHINKLEEQIKAVDFKERLKFFIVHHHVLQYPSPHPKWMDISCMQNSQPLIEMLSKYGFNFIIHGHRHVPSFFSTRINSFPTINLFCAGSYSCEVPTLIAGKIGNLFHIIEIDDLVLCKGRIISKSYDPTMYKWVESTSNRGIQHVSAFGNQLDYQELLSKCVSILDEVEVGSYIEMESLENQISDLVYLQNYDKEKLFEDLERLHKVTKCITSDKMVILIKK